MVSEAIINPRDVAFKEEAAEAVEKGLKKIWELPQGAQEILIRHISDAVGRIAGPWLTDEAALLARYEALIKQGWINRTENDPLKKPYTPSDF